MTMQNFKVVWCGISQAWFLMYKGCIVKVFTKKHKLEQYLDWVENNGCTYNN